MKEDNSKIIVPRNHKRVKFNQIKEKEELIS